MITCLFVVLIFFIVRGEEIICQSEDDYYLLLYKTCIQSAPCRHLYHLYPLRSLKEDNALPETSAFIDYRNQRDYDLFRHQLSRNLIFRATTNDTERRLVLQGLVPDAWLPDVAIRFKDGYQPACNEMTLSPVYAVYALYSMHLYKMVVADEFFCHDPNERLLLDPLTERLFCVCKKGKSCHNESNFNHLLTLLMTLLIFSLFIFALALFANLLYKRYLLLQCL